MTYVNENNSTLNLINMNLSSYLKIFVTIVYHTIILILMNSFKFVSYSKAIFLDKQEDSLLTKEEEEALLNKIITEMTILVNNKGRMLITYYVDYYHFSDEKNIQHRIWTAFIK